MNGTVNVSIRQATLADIGTIAHHRVAMFRDMGSVAPELIGELGALTEEFLHAAMPRGDYLGWLASAESVPSRIVAGVGAQVRRVSPFPRARADGRIDVARGRQALVVNVYTEPEFRRRGIARRLMTELMRWAGETEIDALVLHAAPDGRPLYEQLGFKQTNEMRFSPLGP
jgi:GNAT superfamily N-acetyltransferase